MLADALGSTSSVNCIDLPGAGSRRDEESPVTIQGQVDSVRNSLPFLRLSGAPGQKFHLLAISFGSMVATHWAQHFPEEIAGLVIINPSFRGLSPWYDRLRPLAILHIAKAVLQTDPVKSEAIVLGQVSNSPALYAETSKAWGQIRKVRPVSKLNFLRQLVAASLVKVSARKGLSVPAFVLGSQADRLVNSSRCSQDAAKALNAKLVFHPSAGHDLPLDDPNWLIEQIQNWSKK